MGIQTMGAKRAHIMDAIYYYFGMERINTMTVDLVSTTDDSPIRGLEIKTLEKTDNPHAYRITDKSVLSALESITVWPVIDAYVVDCGEIEEEWAIIAHLDVPPEYLPLEDNYCVFDIVRMDGTPALLL